MYTVNPSRGKFEGNQSQLLAETIYSITLEGSCADLGNVSDFGYYAFVRGKRYGFILSEDNSGFIAVTHYPLPEAESRWHKLETEYQDWEEHNRQCSFEQAVKLVANNVLKVRRSDVYRLLDWYPQLDGFKDWLIEQRPDLKEEILSCWNATHTGRSTINT